MDAGAAVVSTFGFFEVCSEAFDGARCLLDSCFLRSDTPWLVTGSAAFEALPDDTAEALDFFDELSP